MLFQGTKTSDRRFVNKEGDQNTAVTMPTYDNIDDEEELHKIVSFTYIYYISTLFSKVNYIQNTSTCPWPYFQNVKVIKGNCLHRVKAMGIKEEIVHPKTFRLLSRYEVYQIKICCCNVRSLSLGGVMVYSTALFDSLVHGVCFCWPGWLNELGRWI